MAESRSVWQTKPEHSDESGFCVSAQFIHWHIPGSNTDNWGHLGGLLAGFFFAYMAGPLLAVRRSESGFRLEDSRNKQQIWMAAAMVLVAFIMIAAIPFITR
jgi:hypothetical protein